MLDEVAYLCNSSLHDHEIRIVNVQLNRLKQAQNRLLLHFMAVQYIFRDVREGYLG